MSTIAAIATAMSSSGIGIIRISGSEAISIGDRMFRSKKQDKKLWNVKSHTVHYGWIYDEEILVDEVLVLVMKSPNSYTGEDIVEIDCHGGVIVMKRILETAIKAGARLAEPGEFTKRAFLNGKIDLSQAEAVVDVINAKNQYALKSSISQLSGSISNKIKSMRDDIIYQIAFIESALDDPEHISLEGYSKRLLGILEFLSKELFQMIEHSGNGRILSEGIKTVILGKPNAGKSSLMNVLLKADRAIVTDVPGTTRDTLEEHIYLQDISLNIIDTAGIRDTEDLVEKIGVSKAKASAADGDLIIYVVDTSIPLDEEDQSILELVQGKKVIILLNKIDLQSVLDENKLMTFHDYPIISVSIKDKIGIDLLENKIKELFMEGSISFNDEVHVTNIRHEAAMKAAYESLQLVKRSVFDDLPEDFFSIDLMNAYEQLGYIIGEAIEDDLVNQIFSKFCMGK